MTNRFYMTKEQLIALAREGKAHIGIAYTITRYCISKKPWGRKAQSSDYPAIFMSISNEDGSVYNDAAYFTDLNEDVDLSADEAEALRVAIASMTPNRN
jgi:hypothetical protein